MALNGARRLSTLDRLELAILREWERRWPDQKWREGEARPEMDRPTNYGTWYPVAPRPFRPDVRAKARVAAEAMLDAFANRS